jgi:hypothetical protein
MANNGTNTGGANIMMDINYAKGVALNYKNDQWQYINAHFPQGKTDARTAWFSIADLQNFINQLLVLNPNTSGIRIYYGAHSAEFPNPNQPGTDGMHTVLLIPTILRNDNVNHDFDAATGSSDFSQLPAITAMEHADLIPPPCNAPEYSSVGANFMDFVDQ